MPARALRVLRQLGNDPPELTRPGRVLEGFDESRPDSRGHALIEQAGAQPLEVLAADAEETERVDRLSAFVESQAVEGVYEVIDVVDD